MTLGHLKYISLKNMYQPYEFGITQKTVKLVLNKYVQIGSHIWTDSVKSYGDYSMAVHLHQSVYHSEIFVDPNTSTHTQGIERAWLDAKGRCKRARRNRVYLKSNLDEAACRRLRFPETCTGTLYGEFSK